MEIIRLILNHRLNMQLSWLYWLELSSSQGCTVIFFFFAPSFPKLQSNHDSKKLTGFLQFKETKVLQVILVVMYCCYSRVFSPLPLRNWARVRSNCLSGTSFKSPQFLLLLYSIQKKKKNKPVSVPSWQPNHRLAIPNADQQILCRSEYKTAICAERKPYNTRS